jgi:AraC-like DNA-binding protein
MDDDAGTSRVLDVSMLDLSHPYRDLLPFNTDASREVVAPLAANRIKIIGEQNDCLLLTGGCIEGMRAPRDYAVYNWAGTTPPLPLHVYFVVSGEIAFDQGGAVRLAQARDVVLTERPIPRSWRMRDRFSDRSDSILILSRNEQFLPLASSLSYLVDQHSSLSPTEVAALLAACVSLLPLAIANTPGNRINGPSHALSALLAFVDAHLQNADLTPRVAALNFGVSVRYVHKLFASQKLTFGTYVLRRRLELISDAMASPLYHNQRIATLVRRFGFKTLSTFNRAFKARYGVTPRAFRAAAGI